MSLRYRHDRSRRPRLRGIHYDTLEQMKAMKRLQEFETLARPNN